MLVLIYAIAIVFAVGTLTIGLWLGGKIIHEESPMSLCFAIAVVAVGLTFVPYAGRLLSTVAVLVGLSKFNDIDVWPYGVFISLIASGVQQVAYWMLLAGLLSYFGA